MNLAAKEIIGISVAQWKEFIVFHLSPIRGGKASKSDGKSIRMHEGGSGRLGAKNYNN